MTMTEVRDRNRWQRTCPGFQHLAGSGSSADVSAFSDISKQGTKLANWRKIVKDMRDATTVYSVDALNDGLISGFCTADYYLPDFLFVNVPRRCSEWSAGTLFTQSRPVPTTLQWDATADIVARMNFVKKVRKSTRKFQGGVFLGELREAIHMIVRPASSLRKAIGVYSKDVKKRILLARNLRERAKVMSGTYLEHSFGWRPLFSDVDSAMEALANTDLLVPDVVSAVGFATNLGPQQLAIGGVNGSYIGYQLKYRHKFESGARYKGCVAWESENLAPTWRKNWGLTLDNFAPTVWELIPYSFLVDYFSNIGNIIDAASFGTVQLRWGFRNFRQTCECVLDSVKVVNTDPAVATSWRSTGVAARLPNLSRFHLSREPVTSVGVGLSDLQFQIPGVGDWRKWANIAALTVEKVF